MGMLLGMGCLSEPFAPSGARPFVAPAEFGLVWAEVAACAQVAGEIARVSWFVVETDASGFFPCPEHWRGCLGWWAPKHTIYLSRRAVDDPTRWTVRHEMLHDLMQTGDHPTAFARCAPREVEFNTELFMEDSPATVTSKTAVETPYYARAIQPFQAAEFKIELRLDSNESVLQSLIASPRDEFLGLFCS